MSTTGTTIDTERQMLGEVDMVGQERWEEIHRRDRLSTDRPSGGHAVLRLTATVSVGPMILISN